MTNIYRIETKGRTEEGVTFENFEYRTYPLEVGSQRYPGSVSDIVVTGCKEIDLPNLPVDVLEAHMLDENDLQVWVREWFDNPVLKVGYKVAVIYNNNEETGTGIDGWWEYDGIDWEYHPVPPFV
jgi:hypothetical protein